MLQLHVDNAVQVRLLWTEASGTVQAINVLNAQVAGTLVVNQALANTLGAAIKSSFTSSGLAAHVHTGTSLVGVGVRDIRTTANAEFVDTGAAVPGTAATDPLPRATALAVTLRTARAGRSYRGRVYLGGFTEAENDTTASAAGALGTACTSFITAIQSNMNTSALTLAVLSRNREQVDIVKTVHHSDGSTTVTTRQQSSSAGFITPVTAIVLRNNQWDSQRRRTSAGGASTLMRPLINVDVSGGDY